MSVERSRPSGMIARVHRSMRASAYVAAVVIGMAFARMTSADDSAKFSVQLRSQVPIQESDPRFLPMVEQQSWQADRVAVVICDVWDSHHCLNAVRRVGQLAPRIAAFANRMREMGAVIIHAPSDCMSAYETHPCRLRAKNAFASGAAPETMRSWCNSIESERGARYPVDQSDGGEDDDLTEHAQWHDVLESLGRNPKMPWLEQTPAITIDTSRDYITESGSEIWHILKDQGIEHVLLCGVHANMCILGRPFGLRQLREHGFHAVLVRDLTDTMYNPKQWPYVSHFTATDLVVDHIEQRVCQTIKSNQILGGSPFRFSEDQRPHWVVMISEDEYRTERTLVDWVQVHLAKTSKVSLVFESPNQLGSFPGIDSLDEADGLLLSVRRRPLASDVMQRIRAYVRRGKPVLGIRTSSHAFCLRENAPSPGLEQWPEFDAEVFGGSYSGHHRNDAIASVSALSDPLFPEAPSLQNSNLRSGDMMFQSRGSLYQVLPLRAGTRALWQGAIEDQLSQPVAWTFVRADAGKSFYTSLGHESDFEQPEFRAMLLHAAYWLTELSNDITVEEVRLQQHAYQSGQGKQK